MKYLSYCITILICSSLMNMSRGIDNSDDSPIIKDYNRLPALICNVNEDAFSLEPGVYMNCATLLNRLPFVQLRTMEMSSVHLWNYMAVVLLALDTLPASEWHVVQWKSMIGGIINRLQQLYLPPSETTVATWSGKMEETYVYQVDYDMLFLVNEDLCKLLLPPRDIEISFSPNTYMKEKHKGTTFMFLSLFREWDAPLVMIQLLARSYLPIIYQLHLVHDPDFLRSRDLLNKFYIPLHDSICRFASFREIGNEKEFELALTLADSLHIVSQP